MSTRVVLSDSYILVRIFEYSAPVMIDVQVIGSRKYSDNRWEISSRCFPIHRVSKRKGKKVKLVKKTITTKKNIPGILSFMSSYNR